MTTPLPERVAVIETELRGLGTALNNMRIQQGHQEATLNTICINVSSLTSSMNNLMTERTVWKNPLVYISLASVGVALGSLFLK